MTLIPVRLSPPDPKRFTLVATTGDGGAIYVIQDRGRDLAYLFSQRNAELMLFALTLMETVTGRMIPPGLLRALERPLTN